MDTPTIVAVLTGAGGLITSIVTAATTLRNSESSSYSNLQDAANGTVDSLVSDNERLSRRLDALEGERSECIDRIDSLEQTEAAQTLEIERLKRLRAEDQAELQTVRADLQQTQSELQQTREELQTTRRQLAAAKGQLTRLRNFTKDQGLEPPEDHPNAT